MKTLKSLFVGALVALLGTGGLYAQSSFNEDEVVKIDRHNMRDFREGEIIVKFRPKSKVRVRSGNGKVLSGISRVDNLMKELGVSSSEQLMPLTGHNVRTKALRTFTGQPIKDVDMSKLYRLKIDKSKELSVYEAVERFKELPEVEYAEPNYLVYSMAVEDQSLDLGYILEPLFSQLWGLKTINMDKLWNKPKIDEKRPVIAIIDTGVDITHPDLADNIWTNTSEAEGAAGSDDDNNGFADDVHGWDFVNQTGRIGDWNGHGTHCAGIAAAVGNNGIGIVGANPDALIMPVTVMQSDGVGDVATIIKGIDYASANGADVLSMSFGGYMYSIAEEQALAKAYSESVLVAAAGNDCLPINHVKCSKCGEVGMPMFPAAFTFVLGVEATAPMGQRAGFSNYDNDGPVFSQFSEEQLYNYELKAPGVNILSSFPGGTYKALNGTSMACPLAAGAISRLMQCKEYASRELLFGDLIHTMKGNIDVLAAYNVKDSDRKPELTFVSYKLDDTEGGDGDGRPDSGETIKLYPVVRNAWGQAENVKISLEMGEMEDSSLVEFITPTADFGKALSSYGKNESLNPIVFKINDKCVDGRHIKLVMKATCDNISSTASQDITLNVENGVEIGGLIKKDMTLYPNVHYIVTENLGIVEGVTLTIKPGTVIKFKDNTGLSSVGNIVCKGTPDSLITFTKIDLGYGKISGLHINNSVLEYVRISDLFYDHYPILEKCIYKNCILKNVYANGLLEVLKLDRCNILNNTVNIFPILRNCGFLEKCNFSNNKLESENPGLSYLDFYRVSLDCNFINNFLYEHLANVAFLTSEPKVAKMKGSCYFGSSREDIARIGIIDMHNPVSPKGFGELDMSDMLTRPSAEAHGVVWKVVVNGYDAQDHFEELPPLGVGKQKFEVYFNRPMDKNIVPTLAMGVRPPYTQNMIAEDGSWNEDGTVYTAYLTITGKTATDGLNRIYVSGAQDLEHFEIPYENYRFNVQVAAAGSLSTGLMAEPGLGKVTLNWITDEKDFEDLLGYNIYRYTEVPDSIQGYYDENNNWNSGWKHFIRRDTVLVNKQLIDSKELSFVDYEVVPGTTYYYNIKQMTTSLTSYDLSNTVAATPLTATKGDANGSMAVDVADVVTEIAYLTNQNPQPFIFEAADVNSDKNINILDVVGTVGIITQPVAPAIASVNNGTAHYSIIDGTVCLETPVVLGGVQLRIKANKGTEISAMTSLNGFEQVGNWLSEDEYIFLAYSMSGKTLSAGKHELLHIGSDFTVTEVVLSDRTGNNVKVEQAMSGAEAAEIGSLSSPWPNPFSAELHIPYQVSGEGLNSVQIQVTDIAGRTVANYNVQAEEGSYEYTWRPNDGMSEGTYMVSLTIDGKLGQTVKSIYKK